MKVSQFTSGAPAQLGDILGAVRGSGNVKVTVADVVKAAIGVYNVLDPQFAGGADPTGTTSSSPAIQAAINAAQAAGGGEVFIPAGTYKIGQTAETVTTHTSDMSDAGLIVTGNDVTIRGAGMGATILIQAGTSVALANSAFIALISASNARIADLTIDGGFTGSQNGGAGIWGDAEFADDICANNVIERVEIRVHFD
jgi:Pectate lyase superfamily protein